MDGTLFQKSKDHGYFDYRSNAVKSPFPFLLKEVSSLLVEDQSYGTPMHPPLFCSVPHAPPPSPIIKPPQPITPPKNTAQGKNTLSSIQEENAQTLNCFPKKKIPHV